jgi:hypothetical protein
MDGRNLLVVCVAKLEALFAENPADGDAASAADVDDRLELRLGHSVEDLAERRRVDAGFGCDHAVLSCRIDCLPEAVHPIHRADPTVVLVRAAEIVFVSNRSRVTPVRVCPNAVRLALYPVPG